MEISGNRVIAMKDTYLSGYKWGRLGNVLIIFTSNKSSSSPSSSNPHISLVIGPHWPGVLFTSLIIFLITYLNIILASPPLYYQILLILLSILAQLFLYLTALLDPGLNLYSQKDLFRDENDEESHSFLDQNQKTGNESDPYCDICGIHQPLGTAHCSYCNCCIDNLDHHCPWMGKCIGKKNMIWFQSFIGIVLLYMLLVLIHTFLL
jgi:hypothetical protein